MPEARDGWSGMPNANEPETIEYAPKGSVSFNAMNIVFTVLLLVVGGVGGYGVSEIKRNFIDPPEFQEASAMLPVPIYERLKESKKVCVNGAATPRSCMAIWKDVRENNIEVSNQ
jgi:hypothetical protein